MNITETEYAQNILARLGKSVVLNMPSADAKTKRQFSKAIVYLEKARAEFDALNDMKEQLRS